MLFLCKQAVYKFTEFWVKYILGQVAHTQKHVDVLKVVNGLINTSDII